MKKTSRDVEAVVQATLAWLARRGTRRNREGMARYGIVSAKAFGVSMATMRPLVERLGRSHELAAALWETGWLEARTLAAFVDEPARVTSAQMDRWCRAFDNWAICDALCFHLFDETPHAFRKVAIWSRRHRELERRAAFALLAALALHDKKSPDESFLACLPLAERAAADGRNYVKKGVSWALRAMGRRSRALHAAALEVARRLAASSDRAERWVGKDVERELTGPIVTRLLARRG